MTWILLDKIHITTHFLRCLAIGLLEIILKYTSLINKLSKLFYLDNIFYNFNHSIVGRSLHICMESVSENLWH